MIVKVAIDLSLDRLFDYEVPRELLEKLAVGQLLSVPFGHREARGFAMELAETAADPSRRLKPVTAIVDETPFFSPTLLELVRRIAAYTAAPIESVLKSAVPAAVLKRNARPRELMFIEPALGAEPVELTKRQRWLYDQIARLGGGWMSRLCEELKTTPASIRALGQKGLVRVAVRECRRNPLAGHRILPSRPKALNPGQERALAAIMSDAGREPSDGKPLAGTSAALPLLLFGVTGSGKTEVYLQAIAKELEAGRGAIVLVPEISLTPQTMRRFASRFGDKVAVLHSALSDGERYDEWHRIRRGEARVVVGPRSAVFAPVRRLGLIVIDEEHEPSYKQEELPRYHARDVAVLRGMLEGARVVLGSATPSLESWMNVKRGKYVLAELKERAGAGTLPAIGVADMSNEERGFFSATLMEAIQRRLDRHEQSIIFLNRRGYSKSCTCAACGKAVECPDCNLPYTYHRADSCLRCHICGGWTELPRKCPECGSPRFDFLGLGTQRAEQALQKCFPRAKILRMDADSVSRRHSHDDILGMFGRGEADILLGTQMIAKGLDFPNVTLVGVLNADASLNQPDFRAAERTFQLLSQVAGRAGRAELSGEVVIQAYDPSAQAIRFAAKGDFAAFAESELELRRRWNYPPFCHLAAVHFASKDLRLVGDWATMYERSFRAYAAKLGGGMSVGEAAPSALEKADGWYRWQLVLRSERASELANAWRWLVKARPAPSALRIAFDLDAYSVG